MSSSSGSPAASEARRPHAAAARHAALVVSEFLAFLEGRDRVIAALNGPTEFDLAFLAPGEDRRLADAFLSRFAADAAAEDRAAAAARARRVAAGATWVRRRVAPGQHIYGVCGRCGRPRRAGGEYVARYTPPADGADPSAAAVAYFCVRCGVEAAAAAGVDLPASPTGEAAACAG